MPTPPGSFGTSIRAGIRHTAAVNAKASIVNETLNAFTHFEQIIATEILDSATTQMAGEIGNHATLFYKALSSKMARNRDFRVTRIHQQAGKDGQDATVRAFQRRKSRALRNAGRPVEDGKPIGGQGLRLAPSLSRPDRYANGKMLQALRSPKFFTARWDGVAFVNKAHLDQTAKQWYRLNFGAGERARQTPARKVYSIKFFEAVIGTLSFQRFGPSAAFGMPYGAFFPRGGGAPIGPDPSRRGLDDFVPGVFAKLDSPPFKGTRVTKGIKGTNFLDAGLGALTKSLGAGWEILYLEWLQESATQARTTDFGGSVPSSSPIDQFLEPKEAARAFNELRTATSINQATLARFRSSLVL
jgi:hypothetical protein